MNGVQSRPLCDGSMHQGRVVARMLRLRGQRRKALDADAAGGARYQAAAGSQAWGSAAGTSG